MKLYLNKDVLGGTDIVLVCEQWWEKKPNSRKIDKSMEFFIAYVCCSEQMVWPNRLKCVTDNSNMSESVFLSPTPSVNEHYIG